MLKELQAHGPAPTQSISFRTIRTLDLPVFDSRLQLTENKKILESCLGGEQAAVDFVH